jgi:hypothetical protein
MRLACDVFVPPITCTGYDEAAIGVWLQRVARRSFLAEL